MAQLSLGPGTMGLGCWGQKWPEVSFALSVQVRTWDNAMFFPSVTLVRIGQYLGTHG